MERTSALSQLRFRVAPLPAPASALTKASPIHARWRFRARMALDPVDRSIYAKLSCDKALGFRGAYYLNG